MRVDSAALRPAHPAAFDHGSRSRTFELVDPCLRRLGIAGRGRQASGIDRVVLDLLRQRACERRTLYRQYLADLVNGNLGLAFGHLLGDVAAGLQALLRLDLLGNAEL